MPYVGKKPADIIATAVDTTTGTFSGDLTVDTSTLYVDSANNRVGVGTASPDTTTQISKSTTSTDGSVYPTLKIENTSAGTGNSYARFQLNGGNGTTGFTLLADGRSSNSDVSLRTTTSTPMSFYTSNTERMRIDASGKVGLGIDPSTLPSFISHAMKIANGGGLSITSPSSSDNRYIFFGTGTSSSDVQLAAIKNSSSDLMFLGASGSEKMRIDSSGNLLVGKTSSGIATAGIELRANDDVLITSNGSQALYLNRLSSDGAIAEFRKDGTTVGSIGVSGGNNPYFSSAVANHGGLAFSDGGSSTPQMNPISSGSTLVDNAMNIGSASYRFKDLYLGGGAYIGGTSSANKLDDFEEGTFSVTIRDATSGGNTGSVSQNNKYVKIGDTVWMHFNLINITTTGMTSGNNLYFTGLPFTPASGSYGCGSIFLDRFNIDNNRYQVNIFQNSGQSYATVIQNADFGASSATGSTAVVSLFDNSTADLFGTYMIKV